MIKKIPENVIIYYGKNNMTILDFDDSQKFQIFINSEPLTEDQLQKIKKDYEIFSELVRKHLNIPIKIIHNLENDELKIEELFSVVTIDLKKHKLVSIVFETITPEEFELYTSQIKNVSMSLKNYLGENIIEQIDEYISTLSKFDINGIQIDSEFNDGSKLLFLLFNQDYVLLLDDLIKGLNYIKEHNKIGWKIEEIQPVINTNSELVGFYDILLVRLNDMKTLFDYLDLDVKGMKRLLEHTMELCSDGRIKCDQKTLKIIKEEFKMIEQKYKTIISIL